MKKLLTAVLICAVFLAVLSCDDTSLGEGEFWAQEMITGTYYIVKAELRYAGTYCNIWVAKSVNVSNIKRIADIYDNEIYPKMMEAFGNNFSIGGKTYNTMEAADLLGNNDGKLCILLLDIIDGYVKEGGYVAGYFDPRNFYDIHNSNKQDMIYIDAFPQIPGSESSFRIIAHEMQHLMHFVTRDLLDKEQLDLWINEGLSSAAEWLVTKNPNDLKKLRIYDYNKNVGETIDKGNNFFVWENYDNERYPKKDFPNAVLDDYSTVYMFFQWLRIQSSKKETIYKEILVSDNKDYKAVTNAAGYENDFEKIMKDWYTANFNGYNDSDFNVLTKHYIKTNNKTTALLPGEGVFSYLPSVTPGDSGNIKYSNLGNALLTHNVSTAVTRNPDGTYGGSSTPGTITGNTPPASILFIPEARSISDFSVRSYPVSAQEMLRRNAEQNKGACNE